MDVSVDVQDSSSNLLGFMIQNMLDYSQIYNSNLRKNIKKFNIVKTVEKVISIQTMQAKEKNLSLTANFININMFDDENEVIKKK